MRNFRPLTALAVVCAVLVGSISVVAESPASARDSRAKFFDRYQSLADFAESKGGARRGWIPTTRISKNAWASALEDQSARVDSQGRALYIDPIQPDHAPEAGAPQHATPVADVPLADAFLLNSLPGSNRTIYLDFTGHSLVGTIWQDQNTASTADDYTNEQMVMPPYSDDGDTSTFSNTERQNIIDTWSAVAEDYAPFNVNVTTQDPGLAALERSNAGDLVFGVRAVITDSANVIGSTCGCGGIAYVGVFDYPSFNTYLGPALNFTQAGFNGKTISDIVSHEVGHNLGLSHDGINTQGYYGGRDGWAPIMGVGYYEPLVQFSNGTYTGANQQENDFSVMGSYGLSLRTDDHGDTPETATALEFGTVEEGIISTRTEVDYFSFTATAASHDVTISLPTASANLDVEAKLYDSTGTLLSTTNPNLVRVNDDVATGLGAEFTASTTSGATYYVSVDGVGYGAGTTTGYSDYGSLGEYRIVVAGEPLLTLTKGTPAISGTGVFGTSLTGATGTWTDGTTLTAEWYRNGVATGDTDDTYAILSSDVGKTITYRVAGSKSGYANDTATSSGVTITAATLSTIGTPTISGTGEFGTSLTGATGTWADGVSLAGQWYRNGSATGDTDDTYAILASDVGKSITYRVTGSKAGYTTEVVNSSGVTVTAATLPSSGTPEISGSATVGSVLTGSNGTWPSGVTFATQWYRDGSSAGDTDSSYTIQPSDLGKTIVYRVVGSKSGYTSVTANSASVTVAAGTISPALTPTISGTAKVKKTLTAKTTGWMAGVTFTYQWLRNGAAIAGATASTYKLKSSDKGKRISVQIVGTKAGYTTVTQTSAQTGKVKA